MLRPMSRMIVSGSPGAKGRAPRKSDEGRWVITIAKTRPKRREREAENMLPNVERNLQLSVSCLSSICGRGRAEG